MSTYFSGKPAGQTLNDPNRLPQAVLWDMDGTLVETEPCWIEAEFEMAAKYGGEWSHADAMKLVGNDLLESGRYIKERMNLPLSAEAVVEELLDSVVARVEREVPWRAGARELLTELRASGVRCGLVTMSYERFVAPILAELPPGTFEVVVTGDRVSRGKPHPDPYLLAAAELGVDPADCLAVEDSGTGTASAVAAGCPTLVVPNHVDVEPGPGRHFRESLVDLGLADLARLWAEASERGTEPTGG